MKRMLWSLSIVSFALALASQECESNAENALTLKKNANEQNATPSRDEIIERTVAFRQHHLDQLSEK